MQPKPGHLGYRYAEQFKDQSLVAVYHHRRPYPDEAISKLVELVTDEPRAVLDVGCGTGDLARRLVQYVERRVSSMSSAFGSLQRPVFLTKDYWCNGFLRVPGYRIASQKIREQISKLFLMGMV